MKAGHVGMPTWPLLLKRPGIRGRSSVRSKVAAVDDTRLGRSQPHNIQEMVTASIREVCCFFCAEND